MFAKLTDYWDTRAEAIDRSATLLAGLADNEREAAIADIRAAVTEHANALTTPDLVLAAVAVSDDLYKGAVTSERWDEHLGAYLCASAATFLDSLTTRGLQLRYIADNRWDDPERPLKLFPDWYASAGFVYVCSQAIGQLLIESAGDAHADPASVRREARSIAEELLARSRDSCRHTIQVDLGPDAARDAFRSTLTRAGAAGVVTVLRTEPPTAGSQVELWLPGEAVSQPGSA